MLDPTGQGELATMLERAVETGLELGIQVVVEKDGRPILDVSAGHADLERRLPVTSDTLFCAFSATKGVAATALHLQVARGHIQLGDKVVRYWPEFGVHGKQHVTVSDVLVHRAGVPQMPKGTSIEAMCDWDHMVREVAALRPRWSPSTRMGYHAYTFGWLVGELVRRTDPLQRPFGLFVKEEIAEPLGVGGELWLGVPDTEFERIADIDQSAAQPVTPTRHLGAAIPWSLRPSAEVFGRADIRRSCLPGAGGHMTARALARVYSSFLGLGRSGPESDLAGRAHLIERQSIDQYDVVLGRRIRRGLGYLLASRRWPDLAILMGPQLTAFGHSGAGGSVGWVDRELGIAAGLVRNRAPSLDSRSRSYLKGIRDTIRRAAMRTEQVKAT